LIYNAAISRWLVFSYSAILKYILTSLHQELDYVEMST